MTVVSEIKITATLSETHRATSHAWLTAGLGACVGLAAFFALGFQHILPPHKIGWLLYPSRAIPYWDPATYYLGWDFFRHAPWHWPIGLNPSYGMERATSVAFSDSLPLFAFIFKPFSRWLGTDFQYLGIWILTCYILQGMFGALIASRFVKGIVPQILIAVFIAGSPIVIERAYSAFTLMGHWLILWGIYLYLCDYRGRFRWVWIIVPSLALLTHAYFLPMVLGLWAADALKRLIDQPRRVGFLFLEGIAALGVVLFVMWGTGYFLVSSTDADVSGFGHFAINVMGPIDPLFWSSFLQNQPKSPDWWGEGFCYFGLGIIVACCMAGYELMRKGLSRRALVYILPLLLISMGLAGFSISNLIAIRDHRIVSPFDWGVIGRTFRSSGRMFWVPYYVTWIGALYLVTRSLKKWSAIVVLVFLLMVQTVDLIPHYRSMREFNDRHLRWETPLRSAFWDAAAKQYDKIVIVPSLDVIAVEPFNYVPIAYFSSKHHMQTNAGYIARIPLDLIAKVSYQREQDLVKNQLKPDILYIIPRPKYFEDLCGIIDQTHGVGQIDGYNVIAPSWFAKHPLGERDFLKRPEVLHRILVWHRLMRGLHWFNL